MKRNIVIVGHGLAGSILAHTLFRRGVQVMILDSEMPHSASRVSVGLINPFIGPKFNIPEEFSLCMKQNFNFFENIKKKFSNQYLQTVELYRIFQNSFQLEKWKLLPSPYRGAQLTSEDCGKMGFNAPLGAGITKAWKLEVNEFLSFSQNYFEASNSYRKEFFHPSNWTNYKVIFCDGYRSSRHEWFSKLPFSPAQGDVLSIKSNLSFTLSNGVWHIPYGEKFSARVGSNWKHQDIESGPTEDAKMEIFRKINYLPNLENYKILKHVSGVRSGTIDRNPILGKLTNQENYYLFNGFGSRGCTTIAKNARHFADYFLNGKPLPRKVDITRFLNKKL